MNEQFRKGYNYAAGELLRGDKSPQSLENEEAFNDDFDKGIDAAISRVIELKICVDDRI